MKRMWKAAVGLVAGAGAFLTVAATAFAESVTLTNPLDASTFPQVANTVINFLSTTVAIPLTIIFVLVGAFQMITSSGDPEKFSKGRKTLYFAAIGFAVALVATGITALIANILNGGTP